MPWEVYERGAGYRDLVLAFMLREMNDPNSWWSFLARLHPRRRA